MLHSEWPKLHRVLAVLSAIGLRAGPSRDKKQENNKVFLPESVLIHLNYVVMSLGNLSFGANTNYSKSIILLFKKHPLIVKSLQ